MWGYGIPAASFWAGSIFLRRRGDDAPLRTVEAAAILFTVLLAFMEIRHAVNGGDVYRHSAGLAEIALQVCVALAMAIGLERLRIRTGSIVHNIGAILLTVVRRARRRVRPDAAGDADPVADRCRRRVLQPAAARLRAAGGAGAAAVLCGGGPAPAAYANTIAAGALVLALAYVTFEIRRLYHGPVLAAARPRGAEQYTYSIAWLAFGVALLGIGILFNSQRARLASAVVIALTILKAFLIDMSTLTGVYRALSFMCLALVLVAIGWLYQRILFRRPGTAAGRSPARLKPIARLAGSRYASVSRDFARDE